MFKDYKYNVISITRITSFFRILLLLLVMSECPKVHYVALGFSLQISKINLNYSQYIAGTIINVNYNLCLLNMPDVLMRLVLYIWCPNSFQNMVITMLSAA